MSKFATLTVQKRQSTGKGFNRRLRAQGIIPAVFYTAGGTTVPVQVQEAPLVKIFETMGRTTVFNVEIEDNGKKEVAPAIIWDIEYYPTKKRFQHVDFFGVDLKKDIKIRVPLEFIGLAKGVKLGGVLETFFEQIHVVGKPLDLPNKVLVDITNLELGDSLRISDLVLPEGVCAAINATRIVVQVKDKSASTSEDAEDSAKI